jgi:hypothetical protein
MSKGNIPSEGGWPVALDSDTSTQNVGPDGRVVETEEEKQRGAETTIGGEGAGAPIGEVLPKPEEPEKSEDPVPKTEE